MSSTVGASSKPVQITPSLPTPSTATISATPPKAAATDNNNGKMAGASGGGAKPTSMPTDGAGAGPSAGPSAGSNSGAGGQPKNTQASRFSQGPAVKTNRPASQMFLANASHPMPDAEQIDQWFESLSEFEDMLEGMAQVSLDPVFKDELNAIDQWFTVLSDSERTAALYSLMQHATDLQIRFFITILQQMARSMQKEQPQRHSVAGPGAAGYGGGGNATNPRNQIDPQYGRMSYNGPLAAAAAAAAAGDGTANGQGMGMAAALAAAAAANGGNGAGNGSVFSNRNWSVENLPTDTGVLGMAVGSNRNSIQSDRPHSAHGSDQNLNWRNSRTSMASLDGNGGGSIHPGELAPPSQRGSMLGGTPRQSFMDWEPKNFRWSSLSESLEPYGNIGPDPNAVLLAQRLEQQMALAGSRGIPSNRNSLNNRQSINSRLSVMSQDPRQVNASAPMQPSPRQSLQTKAGNNPPYPPGLIPSASNQAINATMSSGVPKSAWAPSSSSHNTPGTVAVGGSGFKTSIAQSAQASSVHLRNQPYAQQHTYQLNNNLAGGGNGHNNNQPRRPSQPHNGQAAGGPRHHSPSRAGQHFSKSSRPQSPATAVVAPVAHVAGGAQAAAPAPAKPQDVVDFELLQDIPAWLRSLRLHKYTSSFEGYNWHDIIEMTDEDLMKQGVAALGARRKMLKVFENIKAEIQRREKQGIPIP
ncbi:Flap-structured DNA-binding and RNA-binding protein [Mycoemilia scoparia]|uniref:Flap-structured DNA-binding and RNA-binding protein n=1 Tax=Mycoemilia scoparia TaxID=417184 RepID=A0A9W7ZJS3_9FUNG|nr:Flap-structured DNA-binding and RNA-binding protein [Mycoemilia scoparia]